MKMHNEQKNYKQNDASVGNKIKQATQLKWLGEKREQLLELLTKLGYRTLYSARYQLIWDSVAYLSCTHIHHYLRTDYTTPTPLINFLCFHSL